MRVDAFNIPTAHPADVSGLERLIAEGRIDPAEVVCIIGKTEGNGGRNDFTRDLAMLAFEDLFSRHLRIPRAEVVNRMIFSLSGGTEGVTSPHIIVFTRGAGTSTGAKRLAIGIGYTRDFQAAEIGRMPQIEETARVISDIVHGLGVSASDVHLVQMKGAIPPGGGRSNMVYSRGASALGAALALGEVDRARLSDDVVCEDWSLYSSVASCSAKPGLTRTEIMVMANSPSADGDLVIDHTVLNDMLDVPSMHALLARMGMPVNGQLNAEQRKRLVGVFAKSEADPRGTIRGKRHTMLTDDDISDTRHSRCVLSSVIASVTGDPAVYVSTRAEHHGPLGGGNMAVIARVSS
ncbi:MAG TPA: ring-opening amidohydrolase [Thermoanaerobaculia bacterium]|nr:ring-opening amidohydrolase [Thermoanaerobaculia bacterium]